MASSERERGAPRRWRHSSGRRRSASRGRVPAAAARASGPDQLLIDFLANEVRMLNERLLEALYVPADRRVLRRLGGARRPFTGTAEGEWSSRSRRRSSPGWQVPPRDRQPGASRPTRTRDWWSRTRQDDRYRFGGVGRSHPLSHWPGTNQGPVSRPFVKRVSSRCVRPARLTEPHRSGERRDGGEAGCDGDGFDVEVGDAEN